MQRIDVRSIPTPGDGRPLPAGAVDAGALRVGPRVVAWLGIAVMGAAYTWATQQAMNPDGISYLDLADAFRRGDWGMAASRYWSLLYAALLAAALWVMSPAPSSEFAAVHVANFVIFLGALAAFEFFLTRLMGVHRAVAARAAAEGRCGLPEWSLRVLGYALFVYASLEWIPLANVTPDMCLSAVVYLASGLLLATRAAPARTSSFVLLGTVLGLGVLVKTPMAPMALVFLGLAVPSASARLPLRAALRRLLAALVPFGLVAGSLVLIFVLAGRGVTIGESGRLNYAWHVNGLPFVHWQGEFPGSGRPVHPTRALSASPPVYEFAAPIEGTYAPWTDPVYWHEGVRVYVDGRGVLRNLAQSARVVAAALLPMPVLLVSSLLLLYLGSRGRRVLRDALPYGVLLLPIFPAAAMFSVMWLEPRYVGAFAALFWLGLFASLTFVESSHTRRAIGGIAAATAAMLVLTAAFASYARVKVERPAWALHRTVAQGLHDLTVRPGDRVAVILDPPGAFFAYWARLAGVRIVAEIPACRYYAGARCAEGQPDAVSAFLQADQGARERVLDLFRRSGATAVVMRNTDRRPLPGWRRIPDTHYDVYLLTGERLARDARATK